MKNKLNVGFVATAGGRWPRELPEARHTEYREWLSKKNINLISADMLTVTDEQIKNIALSFKQNDVDVVVYLIGAFTGDNAVTYIAEKCGVPVIVWAPYEPQYDGGRLLANSLVAATMNTGALHRLGLPYHFIYGSIGDSRAEGELDGLFGAYGAIKAMRNTFLGLAGYRPTAFYSSTFDETLIRKTFGVTMEECDLKVIFDLMAKASDADVKADMDNMRSEVSIEIPDEYLENHSRLHLALRQLAAEQGFDAMNIKCWPEMGNLKTTPCAVLSRIADDGFVIGCEGDIDATLTMIAQQYLAGDVPFMSDLIDIDEERNSVKMWHCGQAGRRLANPEAPISMCDHPLAGQGSAFYTTLKPGAVTIARFCNIRGEYKLFLASGEAVPTQAVTKGVQVDILLKRSVRDMIYMIAENGIPHHYSIIWADVAEQMRLMCKLLGIEVIE